LIAKTFYEYSLNFTLNISVIYPTNFLFLTFAAGKLLKNIPNKLLRLYLGFSSMPKQEFTTVLKHLNAEIQGCALKALFD
jgi:hypothetical protein